MQDPVTGKWGSGGLTFLDLKFDGKSSVSGVAVWRDGSGFENPVPIKVGSFDAKTNALRLEGEGKRPDGVVATFVIEGTIDKDTVAGAFKFGDRGGNFTFQRLPN